MRKLLGKPTFHTLHVHDNFLFTSGSSVDGTGGKVQTKIHTTYPFKIPGFVNWKLSSFTFSSFKSAKVFSVASKVVTGALATGFDIQQMSMSNDFIFTATRCGIVEVWLRYRVTRIASIKMAFGGHHKVTSLVSETDGGMLFAGSSGGRLQVLYTVWMEIRHKKATCSHNIFPEFYLKKILHAYWQLSLKHYYWQAWALD